MKKLVCGLAGLLLGANAALANDWSGPYGGLGVTHAELSAAGISGGHETLFSIIAGTRMALDNGMVLGVEADYSNTTLDSDYLGTLRAVAGVRVQDGSGMLFVTGGYAGFNVDGIEKGFAVGVGYEHKLTDQWSLRADIINNRIDINDIDLDIEGAAFDVLNVRAAVSYQF
jgi:opacity protein-like surface antigen